VDAVITEGSANFDESSLTGESLPQYKKAGEELLSGSINIDGAITAKCLRIAADSQYEQIIKLVRSAAASQAPVVRLADRYSIPFTVFAFVIAINAWVLGHSAIRFLEVIVVATPCPLLLAAPVAIISGMSRAARHGIIIKTGSALERLAEARTIVFDKTGTLTHGELTVDSVIALVPHSKASLLAMAAGLEQNSNHVLAQAIVAKARAAKLKIPKSKHIKETAGLGVAARVGGQEILVGRLDFLRSSGVNIQAKQIGSKDQMATYVSIDGALAGFITFKDAVRAESKTTVAALRKLGIKNILMFTGDHPGSAKAIAKQLGISNVKAHMMPSDKLRAVEDVTERPVAFVGDGVNDAPVLTAADIGIALGARGSTAASESADMVIMLDDVSRVVKAVEIAKRTFRIARQSILGGIFLSVVLMFVFATGKFPPLAGAIIQEAVDVLVILNALRAHTTNS
jgi:heavy metal translocating P-type ATPase